MNRLSTAAAITAITAATFALSACATHKTDEEPLSGPTFERALALLRTEAQSSDPSVRANCIEALQVSADPRATDILAQGLHDSQWVVRFAAAMASGKRRLTDVRPVINTLVDHDPSGSVRAACIFALKRLGDSSHMSDLAALLDSTDAETRANTALVLGLLADPSAIPLLNAHRDEPDIRVRFEITAALARLGNDAAQQVIVSWAVNRYAEDQWNAMSVCADLPPIVGLSPLLLGLQDFPRLPSNMADMPSEQVRDLTVRRQLVAARSLAKLRHGEGAPIALNNVGNPNPGLRALAALALGEMLTSAQAPALDKMLNDPDEKVRLATAAAVVSIYSRAGQAGPPELKLNP